MCDLMTIAVPEAAHAQVAQLIADTSGAPLFSVIEWTNEGGGHSYPAGFATFAILGYGEDCSCDVSLGSTELRDFLVDLVHSAGEVQTLRHYHSGLFASEQFEATAEVELSPEELTAAHDTENTRYILRARPL